MSAASLVIALFCGCFMGLTRGGNQKARIVTWWNLAADPFPFDSAIMDLYTHLSYGGVSISIAGDGKATCSTPVVAEHRVIANRRGQKLLVPFTDQYAWGNLTFIVNDSVRETFAASLPDTLKECGADGIAVDYEFLDYDDWKGVVTQYSSFLRQIKSATHAGQVVAIDIGWYTYEVDKYYWYIPSGDGKDIDYVNVMSYFCGNITKYETLTSHMRDAGFDLGMVNLGLGYATNCGSDITYKEAVSDCPNQQPSENNCSSIPGLYPGKLANYHVGQFARSNGFGGVFPWSSDYDTDKDNNTLSTWVAAGLGNCLISPAEQQQLSNLTHLSCHPRTVKEVSSNGFLERSVKATSAVDNGPLMI